MSQFALPLDWPAAERDDDFLLSDANLSAARHLEHWSLWPVPVTILTGPRKSGRSLLGRLFATKTGGALIDDAWQVEEETLFHAWNAAMASRRPLLIIADAPPPEWPIALPDLASRFTATPRIAIAPPGDGLIRALFEHKFAKRRLAVPPAVLDWLVARIERSYVGVLAAFEAIERAALTDGRKLSVSLARSALRDARVIDA